MELMSARPDLSLPPLTPAQAEQAERVAVRLRAALAAAGGWLSFEDYLRIVLYEPGIGYYSAGAEKLGPSGDFITAPELSELFAHCLARQCAPLLRTAGAEMLELGAGTGRLAAELLAKLSLLQAVPEHYYILEVSASLRAQQQARIAALPAALAQRVQWLEALPARPISGVILANEVADALPFERFVSTEEGCRARGVALAPNGTLQSADRAASVPLQRAYTHLISQLGLPLAAGYSSEICPLLTPWIASLAGVLARGALLLFDYGLGAPERYHAQRYNGTLRCHYRHRAHDDPLLFPGLQDITAWVDFSQVAEAADQAGLEVAGYCTQAAFLLATGIESELAAITDPLAHARAASQARQLLLPGEMGEIFKAIALTRDCPPLEGFRLQDLRRLL
jgi:SAM-dependent MidA family methyltransferase